MRAVHIECRGAQAGEKSAPTAKTRRNEALWRNASEIGCIGNQGFPQKSGVRTQESDGLCGRHDDESGWSTILGGRRAGVVTGRMSGSCRVSPPMVSRGSTTLLCQVTGTHRRLCSKAVVWPELILNSQGEQANLRETQTDRIPLAHHKH